MIKNIKNIRSGFTLIELIIVIAIIGLLAAIVMASLGNARTKSEDAGIKSNLHTAQTEAELFYVNNNNLYLPTNGIAINVGSCPSYDVSGNGTNIVTRNKTIASAIAKAQSVSSGLTSCLNDINKWAFVVQYSRKNKAWCVDSLGKAKEETIGGTQSQADVDAVISSGSCL